MARARPHGASSSPCTPVHQNCLGPSWRDPGVETPSRSPLRPAVTTCGQVLAGTKIQRGRIMRVSAALNSSKRRRHCAFRWTSSEHAMTTTTTPGGRGRNLRSNRLTTCAFRSCSRLFAVCGRCDRGRRFCSPQCAGSARRSSLQRAGRQYQATDRGRSACTRPVRPAIAIAYAR